MKSIPKRNAGPEWNRRYPYASHPSMPSLWRSFLEYMKDGS